MTALAPKTLTLEEYLELERASEVRHEFVEGTVRAMAGEKRRHNRLVLRIAFLLDQIAQQKGCELVFESVKVRTKTNRIRYPDIAVSCAPGDDEYFLENPCCIFEVLSESTAATDTTEKLEEYLKLPGLQHYVLVEQNLRHVIVYRQTPHGWMVELLEDDGEIDIPCLETTLTLEQIYAGLEFA